MKDAHRRGVAWPLAIVMSTLAHQSLRDRLAACLGGVWTQDGDTGELMLTAAGAPPVRLVADDLALIGREQLWMYLQYLAGRRERLAAIVSVAPLPGRSATLLAPDVWRALLAAAGLRIALDVTAHDDGEEHGWLEVWRRADPYRLAGVTRVAMVLEPDTAVSPEDGAALARRLLGPQWTAISPGARVGFLVSSYQDFHTLQPWFARLHDDARCLILRDAGLGQSPPRLDGLRAALAPYAPLPVVLADDARSVLAEAPIDVLVSASESTANLAHLGNAASLLVARGLGVATAHVQHGIWPRAEFVPPVSSVADVVLAWSDEYREVMAPPTRVAVTGAPRFDRYADRVHRDRRGLYGRWTDRYERHVVLATNLHWAQHTRGLDAAALVRHMATRFPETLFTWKPHPYEAPAVGGDLPANVVVLAQELMLAAGIEPADVVEAADLVVTTPSTFALEAALAGRPFLVVSTGNANRHDHLAEHPAAAIESWLRRPYMPAGAAAYVARYCEPHTHGRALGQALAALTQVAGHAAPLAQGTAHVVEGLLGAVVRLAGEQQRLREQARADLAEASRYVESLTWTLARKDEYIAHLHGRAGGTSA